MKVLLNLMKHPPSFSDNQNCFTPFPPPSGEKLEHLQVSHKQTYLTAPLPPEPSPSTFQYPSTQLTACCNTLGPALTPWCESPSLPQFAPTPIRRLARQVGAAHPSNAKAFFSASVNLAVLAKVSVRLFFVLSGSRRVGQQPGDPALRHKLRTVLWKAH